MYNVKISCLQMLLSQVNFVQQGIYRSSLFVQWHESSCCVSINCLSSSNIKAGAAK